MAYNTKNIVRDAAGAPVPQYYNSATDAYEPLQGAANANRILLYDISGNPIGTTTGGGLKTGIVDALPAGTNIIGLVKLTDGTDALAVNANGSINIIPVNSDGTELFTVGNPARNWQGSVPRRGRSRNSRNRLFRSCPPLQDVPMARPPHRHRLRHECCPRQARPHG